MKFAFIVTGSIFLQSYCVLGNVICVMQSSRLRLNLKLQKTVWVIYGPSLSWAKSCLPRPYYLLLHEVQPVIYDWSIEIGQSKNLNLFAAWALQSLKYLSLFCLPILMSKNEGKSGVIFSKFKMHWLWLKYKTLSTRWSQDNMQLTISMVL